MVSLLKSAMANTRRASRGARRPRYRADLESLETRSLLSGDAWAGLLNPQGDTEPNDTLDTAQDLGSVRDGQDAEFIGAIVAPSLRDGESESRSDSATDVDWFRFTLESTGRVQITSLPDAGEASTPVVLTLYGDQLAEFDPAVPLQHRLLGRSEADANNSSDARVDIELQAGTYFVAVSGAGNRHFHPFVVDSGLLGAATDYGVRIAIASGDAPAGNHDPFAPDFESNNSGDDTPDTATNLGDLAPIRRLQVSGMIGDDPFYDFASEDPFAMNPAADVDLYQLSITGDGQFALVAEIYAGRIGSPLDPALTLFRADEFGSLEFVATNNNTLNPTESSNGQFPFFTDAVLFSGLSAGDYFLAVSSSGNDAEYGPDGIFDPHLAHSGLNGGSVGNYVLDLLVYADAESPQVVGQVFNLPNLGEVELTGGQVENLPHGPTHLSLQFSEVVNLQQLAYKAFLQVGDSTVSAVFIQGADGTQYFPRFQSYDATTGTARFLMLDGLPNGEFELHLSGALDLTDLAGNPLVGNDAGGDFIARFTVADTSRVATRLQNSAGNDSFETAQNLGVLFPHELQSGVTVTRDAVTNVGHPADTADFFQFELLQTQSYFVTQTSTGSGAAPAIQVLDLDGQVLPLASQPRGQGLLGFLPAGKYVLCVGPWDAAASSDVTYHIEVELGGVYDNPPPLTVGAAPALQLRLAGTTPLPAVPLQVVLSTGPVGDNLGNTAGAGNDSITSGLGNQTNVQVPGTLLLAFGERLVGGVGVTSGVLAPAGEDRIALRLPDWFERTGLSDLALLDLPWSAQRFTSQDDDVANDESGDQATPQPREAAAELETPSADGSVTDVSSEELPESSDLVSPVEQPSSESIDFNGATSKEAVPSHGVAEEMTDIRVDDADVLDANFAWLPVMAAVLSGSFRSSQAGPRRSGLDGITFPNGGRIPDTKRAPRRR